MTTSLWLVPDQASLDKWVHLSESSNAMMQWLLSQCPFGLILTTSLEWNISVFLDTLLQTRNALLRNFGSFSNSCRQVSSLLICIQVLHVFTIAYFSTAITRHPDISSSTLLPGLCKVHCIAIACLKSEFLSSFLWLIAELWNLSVDAPPTLPWGNLTKTGDIYATWIHHLHCLSFCKYQRVHLIWSILFSAFFWMVTCLHLNHWSSLSTSPVFYFDMFVNLVIVIAEGLRKWWSLCRPIGNLLNLKLHLWVWCLKQERAAPFPLWGKSIWVRNPSFLVLNISVARMYASVHQATL